MWKPRLHMFMLCVPFGVSLVSLLTQSSSCSLPLSTFEAISSFPFRIETHPSRLCLSWIWTLHFGCLSSSPSLALLDRASSVVWACLTFSAYGRAAASKPCTAGRLCLLPLCPSPKSLLTTVPGTKSPVSLLYATRGGGIFVASHSVRYDVWDWVKKMLTWLARGSTSPKGLAAYDCGLASGNSGFGRVLVLPFPNEDEWGWLNRWYKLFGLCSTPTCLLRV